MNLFATKANALKYSYMCNIPNRLGVGLYVLQEIQEVDVKAKIQTILFSKFKKKLKILTSCLKLQFTCLSIIRGKPYHP